jgi:polyisoprenoid-binding protein YceI
MVITFLAPAAAQQVQVTFDPAKTHIDWTLEASMHAVHGTFQLKSGRVSFNAGTGEASGQITVDAASGDSGNGTRDAKMKKEVLETSRYPEIIFSPKHVSGFVSGQESSTIQVTGNFTVHGTTHDLTLTLPVSVKNNTVEGNAKFDVPYVDWGMKNPSNLFLKVEKSVQISISVVAEVQPVQPTK